MSTLTRQSLNHRRPTGYTPRRINILMLVFAALLCAVAHTAAAQHEQQQHQYQQHQQQQQHQQHQQHQQQQQQHQQPHGDMNNRMNELVDSVKEAVHEAEAAADKRQVVDVGQTLHLLEAKFSGLRAALMQEMGANANRMTSHNAVSNELLDRAGNLVKSVVKQREEVRRLSSDMREVDSAIRALREGLTTFEKEVSDLNRVVGDLHITHNELSSSHSEAKSKLQTVVSHQEKAGTSWTHRLMYFMVFVEIVGFGAFLYMKRPGRAMAHKAYGKFG